MAVRDHFRAHARRRVDLGATLRWPGGALSQSVKVRDLGLGGVGLEILDPAPGEPRQAAATGLERDAQVTVELTAPTLWDPLVLSGTIAWIKRGSQGRATRAGVRFEHRDPGSLYALFQLLGAHAYDG